MQAITVYAAHFNLREPPFSIAPDPAFLYMSSRHQEALGHLLYGTGQYGGFVQLTGEVGTGKTTIVRTLLSQKLGNVDVATIHNPRQNELEFVASICDELGVVYDKPPTSIKALVDALNEHLLKTHAAGQRTVLIIDEAQNLDPKVLEQVRLLTNLETDKEKLLRIMLIGQPELIELLARPDLRQLASRITARYHLTPLSVAETMQYIIHRLQVAGGASDLFSDAAVRRVHRYAHGIPRQINIICDRALLGAYSKGYRTVTPEIVDHAAAEALGLGIKPRAALPGDWFQAVRKRLPDGIPLRWIEGALAVAALVITGVLLSERLGRHSYAPPAASSVRAAHTTATTGAGVGTVRPTAQPPAAAKTAPVALPAANRVAAAHITTAGTSAGIGALNATARPLSATIAALIAPPTASSAAAKHITATSAATRAGTRADILSTTAQPPTSSATAVPVAPPTASSVVASPIAGIDAGTGALLAISKPLPAEIAQPNGQNTCRAPSLQDPECYKGNSVWANLLPFDDEELSELAPQQNNPVHKATSSYLATTIPKGKPIKPGDLHDKAIHSRPGKKTSISQRRLQAPEPVQVRRISPSPVIVIPITDEFVRGGTIKGGGSQSSTNSTLTSEHAKSPGQRITRLPRPPIVTLPVALTAPADAHPFSNVATLNPTAAQNPPVIAGQVRPQSISPAQAQNQQQPLQGQK